MPFAVYRSDIHCRPRVLKEVAAFFGAYDKVQGIKLKVLAHAAMKLITKSRRQRGWRNK